MSAPVRSMGLVCELTGCEGPVRTASGAGYLLMTGMVSARGSGRIDGQVTSMSGTGRVRLCGRVKCSSLNSAGNLKFPDRTVRVRGLAQQAPLSAISDLANPSIKKVRTKFIKQMHDGEDGITLTRENGICEGQTL